MSGVVDTVMDAVNLLVTQSPFDVIDGNATNTSSPTTKVLNNLTTPSNDSSKWIPEGCIELVFGDYIPWHNPQNVVSAETELLVDRIKAIYVLPVLCLIGVPSNIINMAVFVKQGLKDRINLCLFALSFADLIYMAQNMVLFGERLHPKFAEGARFGAVQAFMVNHNLLGLYGFVWASQFMSAVIASERCFCILFPLKSKTVLTTKTMAVIIVVAFIVIVGGLFVVSYRFSVICVYDSFSNSSTIIMGTSEFYRQNQEAIDLLDYTVYGLLLPGIFISIVITTTIITSVKLRRVVNWRATTSSSNDSSREVALTKVLICTSILFIVCFLPNLFFRLVCLVVENLKTGKRYHNMYYVMLWLLDMASFVNSSLNFFVYYFMGTRYREAFWQIFATCGCKGPPQKAGAGASYVKNGQKEPASKVTNVSVVGAASGKVAA
ncbi:galanin receptor 2b-like [Littorina saxatilis]|uniref:G-protein coupled receptors family 1 profile domain-containing protein n=1 Tax=Littorina saxatilis TaxID=31220 RepID=A0AAN9GH86_9CAEN